MPDEQQICIDILLLHFQFFITKKRLHFTRQGRFLQDHNLLTCSHPLKLKPSDFSFIELGIFASCLPVFTIDSIRLAHSGIPVIQ